MFTEPLHVFKVCQSDLRDYAPIRNKGHYTNQNLTSGPIK